MNSTNEQQSDPKSNAEIISMGDAVSNGIKIIDNDEWIEISIASSGDTTEDLPISPSKHLLVSNNFAIEGDKPELIPPNSKNPTGDNNSKMRTIVHFSTQHVKSVLSIWPFTNHREKLLF